MEGALAINAIQAYDGEDGTVTVESSPTGTTFTLTFPQTIPPRDAA